MITLYDIDVEIPPNFRLASPKITDSNFDLAIKRTFPYLSPHKAAEIIAATAAMRWRDIYTSMERPGAQGAHNLIDIGMMDEYDEARAQFGEWNEIRIRAIKAQEAK